MSNIQTWRERYQEDDSCRPYGISGEKEDYMQVEIDELRVALLRAQEAVEVNAKVAEDYYREKQTLLDQCESWRCLAAKFEQERDKLQSKLDAKSLASTTYRKQRNELRTKLQELNLQYISDFGQLQEQKPDAIGCTCSVCGEWQRWTPSGMVCKNGHGGAPGVNQRLYTTLVKGTSNPIPTEVRLWDSQWSNVVNHDNCYAFWTKEDAVNHAVKMTEEYIAKNVAEDNLPPKPKEST